MSESEESVVMRFYRELIANGRIEALDEILSSHFVDHSLETADNGREAFSDLLRQFDSAFRNRLVVIEELEVDDEYVSVRWIAGLTHSGPFLGFKPSGEALELSGVDVFRVRAGRITEHWTHEVGLGLREQLEYLALRSEARRRLEGAIDDVASRHDAKRSVTQAAGTGHDARTASLLR